MFLSFLILLASRDNWFWNSQLLFLNSMLWVSLSIFSSKFISSLTCGDDFVVLNPNVSLVDLSVTGCKKCEAFHRMRCKKDSVYRVYQKKVIELYI